jgi:glycosyltransferase involved in cell wall biosynthesis
MTFLVTGDRRLAIAENEQLFKGILEEEAQMALCYAAADVVAFPSLDENYSNTLTEAALCGCPVVCFDTGGNAEIVKEKGSGMLLKKGDWEGFMAALGSFALDPVQRQQLAENAADRFASAPLIDQLLRIYDTGSST